MAQCQCEILKIRDGNYAYQHVLKHCTVCDAAFQMQEALQQVVIHQDRPLTEFPTHVLFQINAALARAAGRPLASLMEGPGEG